MSFFTTPHGMTRRHFMTHLAGASALALPAINFTNALAANSNDLKKRHKSAILLWMGGGPATIDIWDLKPGAPTGGPFRPIATSGDYLQNWTISEGVGRTTYFHIFDPETLRPLAVGKDSVASASVLAKSCAFADGLATAAMMFAGALEAEEWAASVTERYPGTQLWIVARK